MLWGGSSRSEGQFWWQNSYQTCYTSKYHPTWMLTDCHRAITNALDVHTHCPRRLDIRMRSRHIDKSIRVTTAATTFVFVTSQRRCRRRRRRLAQSCDLNWRRRREDCIRRREDRIRRVLGGQTVSSADNDYNFKFMASRWRAPEPCTNLWRPPARGVKYIAIC